MRFFLTKTIQCIEWIVIAIHILLAQTIQKSFQKNGGGVLIVVSNKLDMTPKLVKIDTRAEILSMTLKLKGNKKICITTCYRVGTLDETNYDEITKHIEQISGNKSIKHHIVVNDFNLETVNWHIRRNHPLICTKKLLIYSITTV